MKIIKIVIILFILTPISVSTKQDNNTVIFMFNCHQSGWNISILSNGSVVAEFGSSFGDRGNLPSGTVNIHALYYSIKDSIELKDEIDNIHSVYSVYINESITESKKLSGYLSNDSVLRYILKSNENNWNTFNKDRFKQLLKQRPFFINKS